MAIIEESYIVRANDIEESGKITNRGILSFLENVACKHSDIAGYGCMDIPTTYLSWVLLHWKLEVLKRASYGEKVIVKTWARCAHKCFTLRDFEMYNEKGTLLCRASSKWSLINTETASIARITDDILSKYEIEEKSVFHEEDIAKLKEPELSSAPNFSFSVLRRDIDFNHHMHNLYYLDYAYEALPKQIYEEEEKNHLEIMFKTGAKLGDVVNCYYTNSENADFIVMKNDENKHLNAIIKLY